MKWLSSLFGLGARPRRTRNKRGTDAAGEGEQGLNRNMETGMEMEESSVLWKIKNFPIIQQKDSLIKLQKLKINAGATIGQPSKWIVYLTAEEREGKKWIGIRHGPIKPRPELLFGGKLFSQMSFAIKDPAGVTTWSRDLDLMDISEFKRQLGCGFGIKIPWLIFYYGVGWGYHDMIDVAGSVPPETLEIHLTLKLYSPARKPQATVPSTLLKFHERAVAQARNDLRGLVKNPVPGGDVKIISGVGKEKEFVVLIGILSARSPVFEAMLRTNMTEAITGRILLPDISAKGLEVLLNFIYTGELPPNWKDSRVIVEVTNAAAKYQFWDLLEFLDVTLGKVCDVKNVGPLLALACQLSLKTAQEELLKFAKEKLASSSSVEKFSQTMKIISDTDMESLTK